MSLKIERNEFNLATANKTQLKNYAKEMYDLPLTMNMGEATMRQCINDHCKEHNLDMPLSEAVNNKSNKIKKAGKKFVVNIATAEGDHGGEPVFLGVQGSGTMVPRGIDVTISEALVEILRNAKQDIVTQDKVTGDLIHRDVLTYPFQIVREVA